MLSLGFKKMGSALHYSLNNKGNIKRYFAQKLADWLARSNVETETDFKRVIIAIDE